MKKVITIFIGLIMILSFVSCAADNEDDANTSSVNEESEANVLSEPIHTYTLNNLFDDFGLNVEMVDLQEYPMPGFSAYWAKYGEENHSVVILFVTETETENIIAVRFISNTEDSSLEATIDNISLKINNENYRQNISQFPSDTDNKRKYSYQIWSNDYDIQELPYLHDKLDIFDNTITADNIVNDNELNATENDNIQSSETDDTDSNITLNNENNNADNDSSQDPTPTPDPVPAGPTTGEKNALQTAQSYLNVLSFSKQGLIDQLLYEGYSQTEATYASDNVNANWNTQAVKTAQSYLDTLSFSRQGLIDQLLYEGFTSEQANYGVEQTYK